MCPDSQIAKDFKLCLLNLTYIENYGTAPYIKQIFDAKLKKAPLPPRLLTRALIHFSPVSHFYTP